MTDRRQFLKQAGSAGGMAWLALTMPVALTIARDARAGIEQDRSLAVLSDDHAYGFAAIVDRILPPDESPGAVDLGVVQFLDRALSDEISGESGALLGFLAALNQASGGVFADLDPAQQDARLSEFEDHAVFDRLVDLTLIAALAMPVHGGNRDHLGWQLIGFEHRHAWQAPFGHYDAREDGTHVES